MKYKLGFTLIEMMVTLAIIAVLATLVVPMAQISVQRSKEQELRLALREIRNAIDAYKRASDEGRLPRDSNSNGYPASLQILVDGVGDDKHPKRQKIRFYGVYRAIQCFLTPQWNPKKPGACAVTVAKPATPRKGPTSTTSIPARRYPA